LSAIGNIGACHRKVVVAGIISAAITGAVVGKYHHRGLCCAVHKSIVINFDIICVPKCTNSPISYLEVLNDVAIDLGGAAVDAAVGKSNDATSPSRGQTGGASIDVFKMVIPNNSTAIPRIVQIDDFSVISGVSPISPVGTVFDQGRVEPV